MNRASPRNRAGYGSRMAGYFNRAAAALSMRLHIATANLWRDSYNPMRGLTMQWAARLLEEGERGAYAELQWLYRSIEMQDATLGALIERRTSAIQGLDWDIRTRKDVPPEKAAIAEKQATALREVYESIENLSAALEFLALASFRGFAHLEKVRDGSGRITELAPVDQWFWVRDGIYSKWALNREGKPGAAKGEEVPLDRFVIREVARPVNRVALIAFIRKGLSAKDWDAFIETFGIPAVFVIMPPDVPAGSEEEYLRTADAVVSDARGALPHGSDIKTVDNGARGNNPFKDHLAYQDEQIILRGTGGKLTMLAESGSGTLAGGAHADTFQAIATAEAEEISELLRKQIDQEVLAALTPGERRWAYFQLAKNEETDPAAIVRDVGLLTTAGHAIDPAWIEEKTGYVLLKTPQPPAPPTPAPPAIFNRAEDAPGWATAMATDLHPLGQALESALKVGDFPAMQAALKKISAEMPSYMASGELEDALADEFTKALVGGGDVRNSQEKKPRLRRDGSPWAAYDETKRERDGKGRYTYKPAKEWKPDETLPEISKEEALAILKAGREVTDPRGEKVKFDSGLVEHWEKGGKEPWDMAARLSQLPEAMRTIEHPHEVWQDGDATIYLHRHGRREGMTTFVEISSGKAATYYPTAHYAKLQSKLNQLTRDPNNLLWSRQRKEGQD